MADYSFSDKDTLDFLGSPFRIGMLELPHRLIQGPLAGFSCAPFRRIFFNFTAPAYSVSEMISSQDILQKHTWTSRYLYRDPNEKVLAYQIAGNQPEIMGAAAIKLQALGADLIDINCGCPKAKIRKKNAGSALLEPEQEDRLIKIIHAVKNTINCPLTIKIRLSPVSDSLVLVKKIADAGADALIVHGRTWLQDYHVPCDFKQIAAIKKALTIPVIANGDIDHFSYLKKMVHETGCDAYMISRAGTGKAWLFHELLSGKSLAIPYAQKIALFMQHLTGLANLENEYKAVLQSKTLVRYYFPEMRKNPSCMQDFYRLTTLQAIETCLKDTAVPS